jgi:hypothetical protein
MSGFAQKRRHDLLTLLCVVSTETLLFLGRFLCGPLRISAVSAVTVIPQSAPSYAEERREENLVAALRL